MSSGRSFRAGWLRRALAVVALSAVAGSAAGNTVEVDGVSVEDSATVAGRTLALNGVGWHKRGYVHVGVTALYTEAPVHAIEALENAPGAKRLALVAIRDVPGALAARYFLIDFRESVRSDEFVRLIDEMSRIGGLFSDLRMIRAGSVLTIDVVPGRGVMAALDGAPLVPPDASSPWFRSDLLGRVMLRMYVGGRVPAELQANLLGLSTSMRTRAADSGPAGPSRPAHASTAPR